MVNTKTATELMIDELPKCRLVSFSGGYVLGLEMALIYTLWGPS